MDIGWIERLGQVLCQSGIYADEIGPNGYRNRLKRILGCAEDAAVTAEFMAMYKKDFKKMKVVTQGDSQVCYYGNVKKKDEDEEKPRPLLFAKQWGGFKVLPEPTPYAGLARRTKSLEKLKKK